MDSLLTGAWMARLFWELANCSEGSVAQRAEVLFVICNALMQQRSPSRGPVMKRSQSSGFVSIVCCCVAGKTAVGSMPGVEGEGGVAESQPVTCGRRPADTRVVLGAGLATASAPITAAALVCSTGIVRILIFL